MVEKLEIKTAKKHDGLFRSIYPNPIEISRGTDLVGFIAIVCGYTLGNQEIMQAGMALYQANTGSRT